MKLIFHIDINKEPIDLELEGIISIENDGIGKYEYWGQKCVDYGQDYPVLDDNISWDATKYSPEQVKVIENYIKTNWDSIEERFIEENEKQNTEY